MRRILGNGSDRNVLRAFVKDSNEDAPTAFGVLRPRPPRRLLARTTRSGSGVLGWCYFGCGSLSAAAAWPSLIGVTAAAAVSTSVSSAS